MLQPLHISGTTIPGVLLFSATAVILIEVRVFLHALAYGSVV
jgi:hypothetical protein